MTDWELRIVKHDEVTPSYFALHKVYYNEKGELISWTEEPVVAVLDGKEGIKCYSEVCQRAMISPVLRVSDLLKNL